MFRRLGTLSLCLLAVAFAASCSSDDDGAGATTTAAPSAHEVEARRIVASLVARDFAAVRQNFDATMLSSLPVTQLQAGWDQATGALGPYKEISQVRHSTTFANQSQPADVQLAVVVFEKGTIDVQTAFVDDKVAGLYLKPHLP